MKKHIGILFVLIVLITACAPSPETIAKQTAVAATSTAETIAKQTAVAATSTAAAMPKLEIGDTFSSDSYNIKLIQVVKWTEVTLVNSKSFDTIPPKQSDNNWLIVTIEVSNNEASGSMNLGQLSSSITLSSSDTVIIDTTGEKYELSAVGSPIPSGQPWLLTQIQEQTPSLMAGIFIDPMGGSIFITPDGSQKMVVVPHPLNGGKIDFGNNSVLADPTGPKWYVGIGQVGKNSGEVAQFSLLFEIPKSATEVEWQFYNSLAKLPQPTVGTIPDQSGEGGLSMSSMSFTFSEMCTAWETVLPCR